MNRRIRRAILRRYVHLDNLTLKDNGIPAGKRLIALIWLMTIAIWLSPDRVGDMFQPICIAIATIITSACTVWWCILVWRGRQTYNQIMSRIQEAEEDFERVYGKCPGYLEHIRSLGAFTRDEAAYLHHLDWARLQLVLCAIATENRTPGAYQRMGELYDAALRYFGKEIGGCSGSGYEPFFLIEGERMILRRMTSYRTVQA